MIFALRKFNSNLKIQNILFFATSTVLGCVGLFLLLSGAFAITKPLLVASFLFTFATTFSITAGYHRYFSHRSFQCGRLLKLFFLFFGAANVMNSARKWAADHRRHHRFTDDVEKDPYPITKGFWYAHMGWALLEDKPFMVDPDLEQDIDIDRQDRYFVLLAFISGLALPLTIGWLLGSPGWGFWILGWLRIFLFQHCVFFINSKAHDETKSEDTAKNTWWVSVIVPGEGYHRDHHQFPSDYRSGWRLHHYDPTKWFIYSLSLIGLTNHLRRRE